MDDDIVTLVVESNHYEFSKKKLSERSTYFNIMFNSDFVEKTKSVITLQGVSVKPWEHILHYLKHGRIHQKETLTVYEMLDLLEATSMFQIIDLQEICTKSIYEFLEVDNAIQVLEMASRLDATNLIHKARAIVLWYFDEVTHLEAYYKLNADQVEGYISDPALHSGKGEWGVWEAIERWLAFSEEEPAKPRTEFLPQLIKCLRLGSLNLTELRFIGLYKAVLSCSLVSRAVIRIVQERASQLKTLDFELKEESEETMKFIEDWEKTEPRRLPLVPSVVGNIHTDPNTISPCILKFCEAERKFIPVLRLNKVENTLGSMVGFKVIASGSKLFMLGGEMMTRQSAWNHAVWMYDQIYKSWTFLSNLLRPSRHLSACCVGDDLYVMGGFGRHRVLQDSVYKLSIKDRVWTTCAPLPRPMYSVACCSFKEHIYVVESFVYQYIPSRNVWITLNISPVAKGFSNAMPGDEFIYLSGAYTKNVYKFDPNNPHSNFELVGTFKNECVQSCLVDDYIYSLSQDEFGEEICCEKLNVKTGETTMLWEGTTDSKIADLNPRHHHGCFPLLLY